MNFSLNPFSFVFESKRFPNARTLRTTLRIKIADAYYVFAGTKKSFGIVDYLGMFFPALITKGYEALTWSHDFKKKLFLSIPYGVVQLARAAVSSLLTILSIAVILPVNIVAYFASKKLWEEAKETNGTCHTAYSVILNWCAEDKKQGLLDEFDQHMQSSNINNREEIIDDFKTFLNSKEEYSAEYQKIFNNPEGETKIHASYLSPPKKPSDYIHNVSITSVASKPEKLNVLFAGSYKDIELLSSELNNNDGETNIALRKQSNSPNPVGRVSPLSFTITPSQVHHQAAFFKLNIGAAVTRLEQCNSKQRDEFLAYYHTM